MCHRLCVILRHSFELYKRFRDITNVFQTANSRGLIQGYILNGVCVWGGGGPPSGARISFLSGTSHPRNVDKQELPSPDGGKS